MRYFYEKLLENLHHPRALFPPAAGDVPKLPAFEPLRLWRKRHPEKSLSPLDFSADVFENIFYGPGLLCLKVDSFRSSKL